MKSRPKSRASSDWLQICGTASICAIDWRTCARAGAEQRLKVTASLFEARRPTRARSRHGDFRGSSESRAPARIQGRRRRSGGCGTKRTRYAGGAAAAGSHGRPIARAVFATGTRGRCLGNATAVAAPGPAGPSAGSNEAEPADASAAANRSGQWQVRETRNFRIFHADSRLADKAAESAESVRAAQAKRWGTSALQRAWSPRCEVYLYPDGKAFADATGQPESSPGFSTMESNGKQITTRKVILRADHPQILAAILPHEVTHVVVADLFTAQQIPRWADEGIAVLAEPETEQNLRAADLRESLSSGQVFDLRQLMSIDTPEPKDWSLYYAQSVSLTRFLVEQGTPEQLVQFVRESGGKGIEVALRDIYRIVGFAELQERWQGYARERLASVK